MSVQSITARGRERTAEMYEIRGQLAIVYELTETVQGDGSLLQAWDEVTQANVSFSPEGESVRLAMYGRTELPAGTREMRFVAPNPAIAIQQGVHVTSGAEAGTKWRVLYVDRSDRILVFALVEPYNEDFS